MNRQTAILAAGIALLALAQTHAAHAAEAAQSASEDGAGAEGSGDIIVTAQKKSESIREVPATILVKDGDQLIAAGIRSPTDLGNAFRSEENTPELQSLMRISYAVFGLKKKTIHNYTG